MSCYFIFKMPTDIRNFFGGKGATSSQEIVNKNKKVYLIYIHRSFLYNFHSLVPLLVVLYRVWGCASCPFHTELSGKPNKLL